MDSNNAAAALRARCIQQLQQTSSKIPSLRAFVGLDGFVDEIIHAVDKRDDSARFTPIKTITQLGDRIRAAAGRSTNIELVNQLTKLGGNGPIMANALVAFGVKVTYLGALGYPNLHPVFADFARRADVHTIAEAGHTDALEFEDGKIMFGKSVQLSEITWKNIQERFGRERFNDHFSKSELVGFVNWTMIPHMSDVWAELLRELCPAFQGAKRWVFFDLADPEKRTASDIQGALKLISDFSRYFNVVLGVNEKECYELGKVLQVPAGAPDRDGLVKVATAVAGKISVETLVVHPVSYALTISGGKADVVDGPYVAKPKITTGAGDHFNSGFCLGKLLGLDNALSLLMGVSTSGHYVRSAQSPAVSDLVQLMQHWPADPTHS